MSKSNNTNILGIDVGAVAIALVVLNHAGEIIEQRYQFHKGNVPQTLKQLLEKLQAEIFDAVGINQRGEEAVTNATVVNEVIAMIQGAQHHVSEVKSILSIGGETFGLVLMDPNGFYKKYLANSACAAGTGLFLDQQAVRLGFSDSSHLLKYTKGFEGDSPKIATRCGVFAKTDLIHAQQKGYSLQAICDGLLQGVASNIANALFSNIEVLGPVVAIGGVSKNERIINTISSLTKVPIQPLTDPEFTVALGVAKVTLENFSKTEKERKGNNRCLIDKISIPLNDRKNRSYEHPPLVETTVEEIDFSGIKSYINNQVEIDIYEPLEKGKTISCFLGIDIGSTSTKSVLTDESGTVFVGLYTRTQGQPINAIKRIMREICNIEKDHNITFDIIGSGTTGSGRNFIQKVCKTDLAVNEISAHAKAAHYLDPRIDTIIEIGGQDAKFTLLKNGEVTFSIMNYVCAAGTGSFIEEQCKRLNCSITTFAQEAIEAESPMISDRCSVFMERDLNQLLSMGYTRQECLAAVAHSVRDNYLSKVAHISKIGNHIAFQGATAKNSALVRSFAQKLKKPIHVSKFCHLTGALGVCLSLKEKGVKGAPGKFKKNIYEEEIKTGEEICPKCPNSCKISTVEMSGEKIKWGYLCGLSEGEGDREKGKTLKKNRFDVLNYRKKNMRASSSRVGNVGNVGNKEIKIGIPSALTFSELMPFWESFFKSLGIKPVIPAASVNYIDEGKLVTGVEFCSPIVSFLGQLKVLKDKSDYLFCPHVLETVTLNPLFRKIRKIKKIDNLFKFLWKIRVRKFEKRGSFCYYSNYITSIFQSSQIGKDAKLVAPNILFNDVHSNIESIWSALPDEIKEMITKKQMEKSYHLAWSEYQNNLSKLKNHYQKNVPAIEDIGVVLLGRPYLVLDRSMNKNIPNLLTKQGASVFTMDMVPCPSEKIKIAKDLLKYNQWEYGKQILETAEIVAQTDNVFPILMTAFKCSPDSFLIRYFKEIMDAYGRPYLILQVDDHNTGEGYETRLEAALETFRNSSSSQKYLKSKTAATRTIPSNIVSIKTKMPDKKTFLIPPYDMLAGRLIQAAFMGAGHQAVMVEENSKTIESSLNLNDGQCLPITMLAYETAHTVAKLGLDPANTALFLNSNVRLSCNFPQYPVMIKRILEELGDGMEQIEIFSSLFIMSDLPPQLVHDIYTAFIMAGTLRKLQLKIRPREVRPGETNSVLEASLNALFDNLVTKEVSSEEILKKVIRDFKNIQTNYIDLPQVVILGDMYVRDNDVFNQNLMKEIEECNAEVVMSPFLQTLWLIVEKKHYAFKNSTNETERLNPDFFRILKKLSRPQIKELKDLLEISLNALDQRMPKMDNHLLSYLKKHQMTYDHKGETAENLLKIYYLKETYPNLKLIVNVNPIFCCPALVSEAVYSQIEKEINVPIVSINYDGTKTPHNQIIKPYLYRS